MRNWLEEWLAADEQRGLDPDGRWARTPVARLKGNEVFRRRLFHAGSQERPGEKRYKLKHALPSAALPAPALPSGSESGDLAGAITSAGCSEMGLGSFGALPFRGMMRIGMAAAEVNRNFVFSCLPELKQYERSSRQDYAGETLNNRPVAPFLSECLRHSPTSHRLPSAGGI